MNGTDFFIKQDYRFDTAENGDQVAKQSGSSRAESSNGFIPDQKTNYRSAKPEIKDGRQVGTGRSAIPPVVF